MKCPGSQTSREQGWGGLPNSFLIGFQCKERYSTDSIKVPAKKGGFALSDYSRMVNDLILVRNY